MPYFNHEIEAESEMELQERVQNYLKQWPSCYGAHTEGASYRKGDKIVQQVARWECE